MITLSKYYQPVPFDEYRHVQASRNDCEDRYKAIQRAFGEFSGKRMLDIACSNGYFGFRFLLDGGEDVIGVDTEIEVVDFCNQLALQKGLSMTALNILPATGLKFDIGLYLDTHYHPTTRKAGYLKCLKDHCGVVFTSCRNKGGEENKKYEEELRSLWSSVVHIYTGFNNRKMFVCE